MNIDTLKSFSKKALPFFIISILALSLTCRLHLTLLTVLGGLLIGWLSVQRFYLANNAQMNLRGDVVYFVLISLLIYLTLQLVPYWCTFLPNIRPCSERLQGSCAILIILPLGISAFSLWLWFRIRGHLFLSETN